MFSKKNLHFNLEISGHNVNRAERRNKTLKVGTYGKPCYNTTFQILVIVFQKILFKNDVVTNVFVAIFSKTDVNQPIDTR